MFPRQTKLPSDGNAVETQTISGHFWLKKKLSFLRNYWNLFMIMSWLLDQWIISLLCLNLFSSYSQRPLMIGILSMSNSPWYVPTTLLIYIQKLGIQEVNNIDKVFTEFYWVYANAILWLFHHIISQISDITNWWCHEYSLWIFLISLLSLLPSYIFLSKGRNTWIGIKLIVYCQGSGW